MPTKIKRKNIPIYEPLLDIFKEFLGPNGDIGKATWNAIKKDMLNNNFSKKKIIAAERKTPWK